MQQTAFNLLAIGIFTITLTILLGPLLHISPAIPAVVTFSVLGLATVDTLGWQNRGTTLLLDSLSSAQYRERVVRHEAGHFLAAYFLGIPVTGYTLTAWEALQQNQPGIGGVRFDTSAFDKKNFTGSEMRLILDRFCTVWMAGIAAEQITYGKAEGGGEDREKIREALQLGGLSTQSSQKQSWALLQAKNLIEKHRNAYEALVKSMQKRASIEECCQQIQQNIDNEK